MKTLAKMIGGLLALVIVAALAAPMFISSDTLKAQLIAQVKKATGRTLDIKGETSVTFFPNIAVTAQDVSLGNPENFATPTLIALKKLSTGAQLMPLLRGELVIDGITLEGAEITLEETKSGAKNWEFTNQKSSKNLTAETSEPKKNSPSAKSFSLGDVIVRDSAVTIIKSGAKPVKISAIDLAISGTDGQSPLQLDGSAMYRNEQVSVALDMADTKAFLRGESAPLQASLVLPGASLDFNGKGRMGDAPSAQGALAFSASSLPKVLAWATGKPASAALPTQVSFSATMQYADKILALKDTKLRADTMQATGALRINHAGAVPAISGDLQLGTLDLNALMKPSAQAPSAAGSDAAGSSSAPSSGWSSTPVDVSGLKAVNTDLGIAWDSLKTGKLTVGAASTRVAINAGKLAFTITQAQLYGGTASGVLRASAGGVGADMQVAGVDIDALMTALSGRSRLAGKSTLKLAVNAQGNNQRAWVNSLAGQGSLRVTDGALKGMNIGQFLRDAKQGFLADSESAATDFSELTASFTIAGGVVSNRDLAMKAPALRIAGSGTVNLPAKTVDYRLVPTVAATSKGQGGKDDVGGVAVPLLVAGPWSKLRITPDVTGAIMDGLQDPAAFEKNIKQIGESVKDLNSPDDLKRALLGGSKPQSGDAPTSKPATTDELIQQGVGGLLKGL